MSREIKNIPRECLYCGCGFMASGWKVRRGLSIFCSKSCKMKEQNRRLGRTLGSKGRLPLNEIPREEISRAIERAPIEVTDLGCHVWLGPALANGYGSISIHGHNYVAHRAAWVASNGPVQAGLDVCHRCDFRRCVNINHLFVGTRQENMLDCIAKGRATFQVRREKYLRGEQCRSAKLRDSDVLLIRRSTESNRNLAKQFSVAISSIRGIKNGKTWRHLL